MAEVTLEGRPQDLSRRRRGHEGRQLRRAATASSACWSARRAAASPRCCAWSRASRPSPSGEIDIGERVVNEIEPSERDIAMVFQNYALYPHMSVYDNMAYGLRNRKTPKDEIDTRVREAARILEIDADARPQAAPALRRPAPARRDGPRDRAPAESVPVRRAAVEPRRQAARLDARRDPQAAEAARHHVDLRHPRPARGDDARRHAGGDEWRPGRADRRAARRSTRSPRRPSSRPSSARRR